MDSWNNSENPSLKGHRVSNGFNEHLFRFHSLALESKRRVQNTEAPCACASFFQLGQLGGLRGLHPPVATLGMAGRSAEQAEGSEHQAFL